MTRQTKTKHTAPPEFGLVIVGDELLSGKRRDGHFKFMVDTLGRLGGKLAWARMVVDDISLQAQTYRETLACDMPVFSFGGIGATPDDLTRKAAALAFERPLLEHPQGIELLRAQFKGEPDPRRRQLVYFPEGAELIPNPVNRVPGFSLHNHFFVPGFPNMAHPMVEWVLETRFSNTFHHTAEVEHRLLTRGVYESSLIPLIEQLLATHPELKVSCLPKSDLSRQVELGVKGEPGAALAGDRLLRQLLDQAGINYRAA